MSFCNLRLPFELVKCIEFCRISLTTKTFIRDYQFRFFGSGHCVRKRLRMGHAKLSIMAFGIMTHSKEGLLVMFSIVDSISDTKHKNPLQLYRVSLCWVSHFIYYYAEYCYAECCYALWHYAECHYNECHYVECHHLNAIMLNVVIWMSLCLVSLCWVQWRVFNHIKGLPRCPELINKQKISSW